MEDLKLSISQYKEQLSIVNAAISATQNDEERDSLVALQSELQELIQLTQESLEASSTKAEISDTNINNDSDNNENVELDDEYALFMQEMAKSGAYATTEENRPELSKDVKPEVDGDSDIEDELATLLGMKCAVYHTHKWGGQPSLHNAMVSQVVPHQDNDQFKDLQVRVLFTHPTHSEMLPCPFYLNGECRFEDEKCRYSHGNITPLSDLKDAIEPNFEAIKIGSRILLKLKPPEGEDTSLTKKTSEKYHLWHRAVVKRIDLVKKSCLAKLEHGVKSGEKRKSGSDEIYVLFEEIFPLNTEYDDSSDSDDSLSDTEYPENKSARSNETEGRALLIERSLQNNAPAMGEWERHTRGMGSKLMLAMGYVPGTGLGASSDGRVQPVEARVLPVGKSLDQCMSISEKNAAQDPLKVEQRLKRLQKKEEERNKRLYEREKERERRNVFNFLNRTLGNNTDEQDTVSGPSVDLKQSTSKDLNIEQFKITEDVKKVEKDIAKLNSSLSRHASGSTSHKHINIQIQEKSRELSVLKSKEQQISKEQTQRKDKQKLTIF